MKNNWPVKKLGEVANLKRGPFGGSLKKDIFVSEGYKVYEQKNAINNDFTLGSYYITEEKYKQMEGFAVHSGDIIVSCSGTVGQVAIAPPNVQPGIINQALLKITPIKDEVSTDYLTYVINSEDIQKKMFGNARGSSIKNVASIKEIKETTLSLPGINSQQKIVERLDAIRKAQELCDQQIQKAKELFESVLIEIEKIKGSKVKISDICFVKGGKRIPKGLTFSSNKTNRPYLRVADFKDNSVDINNLKYIDDLVFEKISNYIISKDDVYISVAGTTGLIGLIPESLDKANLTENAAKLVIKNRELVSREYLMYCLLIPSNQSSFRASTHSTSVGKLALFRIQNTNINLPTLQEQQRIVEKLEAVQNYKKLLQKEKTLLKELFESVLDKSMKGELDN